MYSRQNSDDGNFSRFYVVVVEERIVLRENGRRLFNQLNIIDPLGPSTSGKNKNKTAKKKKKKGRRQREKKRIPDKLHLSPAPPA